jgi:hypothetical protein
MKTHKSPVGQGSTGAREPCEEHRILFAGRMPSVDPEGPPHVGGAAKAGVGIREVARDADDCLVDVPAVRPRSAAWYISSPVPRPLSESCMRRRHAEHELCALYQVSHTSASLSCSVAVT